jgi:DNA polymerase III gamma/tau subunit
MNVPLINKYRPATFDEIIGHEEIMRSLKRSLKTDSHPHAFLFSGPGGIGKTSTARIVASFLDAEAIEIDAASHSGVDDMRELVNLGAHMALSGEGKRAFIIDECHSLSKSAWQAILKILEEPPIHLYLMLCTTELAKVPDTIKIRCFHAALKPLRKNEIADLLEFVAEAEGWTVHPDVHLAVLQASTGQPRKALSLLQAVHDCQDKAEVARIIQLNETSDGMLEILRLLVQGRASWAVVRKHLENIEDDDWEQALIMGARYIMKAMLGAEQEGQAKKIWHLLDAMLWPSETFDKKAQFYAAIGRMFWGQ